MRGRKNAKNAAGRTARIRLREFTLVREDLEGLERPPTAEELYPLKLLEFALFGHLPGGDGVMAEEGSGPIGSGS